MHFSIDEDAGTHIVGWVMPDHPSATPYVKVFINGEVRRVLPATVLRPLLREHGLHDTGICGFYIDDSQVPGLSQSIDVELYDDATNIRIYRRRPASAVADAKLFRLELRLLPLAALNEPMQGLFHMIFTRLDRFPEEAVRSMIGIPFSPSVYCTGRVFFRSYEPLLRHHEFTCSVMVRDPFEELAEQLLVFRWAAKNPNLAFSVLNDSYRAVIENLSRTNLDEMADFESFLGTLPAAQRRLLTSPMARLLTCRTSDEDIGDGAVEGALLTLSEMDVVGLSGDVEMYWDTLEAVLDVRLPELPGIAWSRQIGELAEMVCQWPAAQDLLAADLEIYADVRAAFTRVAEAGDEDEAPVETTEPSVA
ncbi:hypothetical protein LJE71_18630 [Xanthobacter autotrophicus]|uniref:hypothetical protein n=1 Tax=Xanthobacter TaxID=279 RepID=UPI001E48F95C|nr:hypothetical protein [Xanthobacter autotrophicus]UDQ88264.1 hypothetical protein LJE71_18630 [Xanthobacter autotrophicus]